MTTMTEFEDLLHCISTSSGYYPAVFDHDSLRNDVLNKLSAALHEHSVDTLILAPDTDIVALVNPRLEHISLVEATQRVTEAKTAGVILVREADAIDPHTWSLLFALMRDLPVLNLACVACWRPEQQTLMDSISGQCRDLRQGFVFNTTDIAEPRDHLQD